MRRFYFDFVSPAVVIRDGDGVEFNNLTAAHWRAVKLALWIRREFILECGAWRIEVRDDRGSRPLAVFVPPAESITKDGDARRPLQRRD